MNGAPREPERDPIPGGDSSPAGEARSVLARLIVLAEEQAALLRRLAEALGTAPGTADSGNERADEPEDEEDDDENPALPPWVDEIVSEALGRAFGAAEPAEKPGDREAGRPDEREEDALLLIGDGTTWVGTPWSGIRRVALADEESRFHPAPEAADAAGQEWSLRAFLGARLGSEDREPYRLIWVAGAGECALRCARVGRIMTAAAAAERGVEGVIVAPAPGRTAPTLLSLIDYLAAPSAGVQSASSLDAPAGSAQSGSSADAPESTHGASFAGAPPESAPAVPVMPPAAAPTTPSAPPAPAPPPPAPATPPAPSAPVTAAAVARSTPTVLLGVRNLPARMALCRLLRETGWEVVEALDPTDLRGHLVRTSFDALILDPDDGAVEENLPALRRATGSGSILLPVRSRWRRPRSLDPALGAAGPLLYPFGEVELAQVRSELKAAHLQSPSLLQIPRVPVENNPGEGRTPFPGRIENEVRPATEAGNHPYRGRRREGGRIAPDHPGRTRLPGPDRL